MTSSFIRVAASFFLVVTFLWSLGEAQDLVCENGTACEVTIDGVEDFQVVTINNGVKTCIRCLFEGVVRSDTTWTIESDREGIPLQPPLATNNNGVLEICNTEMIIGAIGDFTTQFICFSERAGRQYSLVIILRDLDAELETLVNTVTENNYVAVVSELSSLANRSVMSVDEQTEENLNRIATVFDSVASLIVANTLTLIEDNAIMGLVETLNSILQWPPDVLTANGSECVKSGETSLFAMRKSLGTRVYHVETLYSTPLYKQHPTFSRTAGPRDYVTSIIEDFELIAAAFADHSVVGIEITTPDIAFVAENLEVDGLRLNGRSFSSLDVNGEPDPNTGDGFVSATLAPTQNAFINLPPSLFDRIPDNRTRVGVFFAVYDNPSLFPVAEPEMQSRENITSSIETRVLSPVIAATVGPGLMFVNLIDPVAILLRLQELGDDEIMSFGSETCVSWDFSANGGRGNWTTEGCETVSSVNGVVTCECDHLTNFAILVDICSRINGSDCTPPPALTKALEVLTIIGVSLSLLGLVITIITLLAFKVLRDRDPTKFHVQLSIAMICMLLVFVIGINRTEVYGVCVTVSVLIHYFTLVAVMWMAAEALLMFQKLVIVFVQITTKYIIIISLVCWLIPLIPVAIPLIVDLTTRPEQDIVVNRQEFCFLNHPGAFFGAFLAPIFALLLFNVVIFIWVIVVLVRHTKSNVERQQEGMKKETAIRLLISITGVMFLFGLTWLFGALTITVTAVNLLFQILFVVFNSLQGFFIFLFFCVFSKEARESWKEVLCCGRYKSEFLHPSQAKLISSGGGQDKKKLATASTGLDSANKSYNLSEDTLDQEERYSEIPMASIDETKHDLTAEATDPSTAQTFKGTPESEKDTNIDSNKENAIQSAANGSDSLKARVKRSRHSTKKGRHHVEKVEIYFSGSDESDTDLDLGGGQDINV